MNTRAVDRWLDAYGESHQNTVNEALHLICVPVIVMCLLSFLSLVPWQLPLVPALDLANLLAIATVLYYLRLSWCCSSGLTRSRSGLLLVALPYGSPRWGCLSWPG